MKRSTSNRGFNAIPAAFELKTIRAPNYSWQKQVTHHTSDTSTCLCTLDSAGVLLIQSKIARGHPLVISGNLRYEWKPHVCIRKPICRCSCLINTWKFPANNVKLQIVAAAYIVPSSNLQLWPQVGQLPRLFCGEHFSISFRTLKQKCLETVTCRLSV